MRAMRVLVACSVVASACGGTAGTTTTTAGTTTSSPATTVIATTTTVAATTTTEPAGPPLTTDASGGHVIDWDALQGPVFFAPPEAGSDDPFFHVHTDPAVDGFFFSVEAYTTGYGTMWTGQLGPITVGCTPQGSGICLHFDPDGPGPLPDLNADFQARGYADIIQADADGFVAVFTEIRFSDGSTIPGPLTVSGGSVTG